MGLLRIPRPGALILGGLVVVMAAAGCGGTDWVEITGVQAAAPEAEVMTLLLDTCHPAQESAPTEDVLETSTEIRVTLAMRVTGEDRDGCVGTATVELSAAIGLRTVVDTRSGRRFDVAFGSPDGAPAPTTTLPAG